MELDELKRLHDKAYQSGQTTRQRAADDLVFYWITHWDDSILESTQLAYRGEFDILRKAGRSILSDLASNPVQVDFEPKDERREDAAEILDGLYRADCRNNTSLEAFANADTENVVCGVGAWLLYNDYESTRGGDTSQVIRRRPIYEANNCVFWDPNAKLLDKSDARYVSVLSSYSEDGYLDLVEDLTGERPDSVNASSFASPEISYTFPWVSGEPKKIYVVEFYRREKVREKILAMVNPFGQEMILEEDSLAEIIDDMLDAGFEILSEKTVERWQVTKYVASGAEILYEAVIPGEHLPVVPVYGERAFIEGEEHYEGITRLAKDPQRLRDFQLSYLADIASRSPREKPIFHPEQVAGFQDMYAENGADNNYPYLLANRLAADGSALNVGPVAMLPAPNIPPALVASIDLSRQAVEDVANAGLPQDIADPDLSGKAVLALQNKIDQQSFVYQSHRKHAHRRDGEIYASMAAEIYDVPRKVLIELPDGTRKQEAILETVVDEETGDIVTLKDLTNAEFNVYSTIGPSYGSMKQQTLERLDGMIQALPPGDPMRNILLLKALKLMDGVDFDDVREYATNQLIILGIKKPETPEQEQMLAEAQQQGQQPSAEMVLAQAEMLKGQAEQMRQQIEAHKMQLEFQSKNTKSQIEAFDAQTKRISVEIDAQEAGAKINKSEVETFGKQIDNQAKIIKLRSPKHMSTDDLVAELMGG